MKPEVLNLGKKLQQVFVATADSKGLPHVAVASGIVPASGECMTVSAWFCPGTIGNHGQNGFVSLVLWDSNTDEGYQLLGKVEKMEEEAMMNGYSPELETRKQVPQVKWKLTIHVDKILDFTQAPHTDVEVKAIGAIGESA
jgi:uncharacterized protein